MLSTPAARGCGKRKAGGVYIDMGLVPAGTPGARPVDDFLIDPPVRVSDQMRDDLGVKPVGVTLVDMNGVTHVIDWVGESFYPNVADYVEEVKHLGLSRRCELAADEYARLTRDSQIILVHPRAWIDQFAALSEAVIVEENDRQDILWHCPKNTHRESVEASLESCCLGLAWCDLVDCDEDGERAMPSFSYTGTPHAIFEDELTLTYTPAIFAQFPISQLVVVRDSEDPDREERAHERASRADLPVYRVEE